MQKYVQEEVKSFKHIMLPEKIASFENSCEFCDFIKMRNDEIRKMFLFAPNTRVSGVFISIKICKTFS